MNGSFRISALGVWRPTETWTHSVRARNKLLYEAIKLISYHNIAELILTETLLEMKNKRVLPNVDGP